MPELLIPKKINIKKVVGSNGTIKGTDISVSPISASVNSMYGDYIYEGIFTYPKNPGPATGPQDPIILPPARFISFTIAPFPTGTYLLEATTDPLEKVLAGDPDVVWVPWTIGQQSGVVQNSIHPATSIRVVLISGGCRLTIRGI